MLYGKTPFYSENPDVMYKNILEGEPVFPKEYKYSPEAIEFIKLLLKKSTAERIGYDDEQEIFTHPWFNDIDFPKLLTKALPAKIIPHLDEEILQWIHADSADEDIKELDKKDISFEMEEERAKKRLAKKSIVNSSEVQTQNEKEDSFDNFSYFEEEEFVETAVHDHSERALLNEKFEEERRIQLITNQPEYSFEASDVDSCKGDQHKRDALNSPRDYSGRRVDKKTHIEEFPDNEMKLNRRQSSYDGQGSNSEKLKKPERKGSDAKQKPSSKKRSDSGERAIKGQILEFPATNSAEIGQNLAVIPEAKPANKTHIE
jgi:serine/threonine protein kinase